MESNVTAYKSKIRTILEKLLCGKCQNEVDKLLNKFLQYLWKQEEKELKCTLITLSVFTEWIKNAVSTWSVSEVTPHPCVASFTLRLAALLSMKEERFDSLNSGNFFINLINVSKARDPEIMNTSVKLAYIKLLSAFLEHKSGLEWIVACNFWEDIFHMSLSIHNDEIVTESTLFVTSLLEKTVNFNETFSENVVKLIKIPLSEKILNSITDSTDVDTLDERVSMYIKPTLRLVGNILEHCLEDILFGQKNLKVVLLFVKHFCLEDAVSKFASIAQTKGIVFEIGKVIFIMEFLELYIKVLAKKITAADIAMSIKSLKTNFVLSISSGNFDDALEFCCFGQLYWNVIDAKIPKFKPSNVTSARDTLPLANQLIVIHLMPNFFLIGLYFPSRDTVKELLKEEFRDTYLYKLTNMLNEDMMRATFTWRNHLITRKDDLFKLNSRSITCIKNSRKYYSRDRAIIVFQALIYNMKDFTQAIKDSPGHFKKFVHETSYFAQVLEVLVLLIEDFDIKWKDSIEAIDVMAITFDFLTLPRWSKDIIVQVLKLINVALVKYLAPNMALLVDSTNDSSIALLGPLLYAKLYDEACEVKREALEVICTVACMSGGKFPSLQKVLMDSELPTLVVKMSTCDGESFVRATAIKCLQEMIQVEEIWNNALKTEDLPQKMRDVLLNETEGIVRVEAATFMCVAYEHQQFQKENLDQIYETMIYSSTTDLHWEVKVRALNFWDKVIKNHLQNQGMIDDSFPNVTFSKEHRKIVTLTDSEIRKRLLKVLNQLSSIGCLGVLMSAIKDDCDMEVSKTAVKITQRLVDLFKKYNLRSDCSAPTSPAPTENGTVSLSSGVSVDESMDSPRSSHPDLNEEIIDQIVNSKDVCLLKTVYSPSDYGSVSNYDIQVRKVVTPNEFLQFTQQDLNSLIADKKNWLNGIEDLGSLLDDMLKTYEDDVNNMDCY